MIISYLTLSVQGRTRRKQFSLQKRGIRLDIRKKVRLFLNATDGKTMGKET